MNSNLIPNRKPSRSIPKENYITVETRRSLVLKGRSEEFKQNLRAHIEIEFCDPLCRPMLSNRQRKENRVMDDGPIVDESRHNCLGGEIKEGRVPGRKALRLSHHIEN